MDTVFHHLPKLPYTVRAIVILATGVMLLRFVGKRSIAQLTIPESVFIIAIGTILIQPLGNANEWAAIYGGLILVVGMIVLSWCQIRFSWIRKFVFGVPTVLIQNGIINSDNLKRVRMTTDQLEMRLRMSDVLNSSDVKTAILEPSGLLSVSLKEHKKPAEKIDVQAVINQLSSIQMQLIQLTQGHSTLTGPSPDLLRPQPERLFAEAIKEDHTGKNLSDDQTGQNTNQD